MGRGGKEIILDTLLTSAFMKAKVQKKYIEVQKEISQSSNNLEFKVHTVSVDTPTSNWQIPRVYTILDPKNYFKKDLPNVNWNFKEESINAYKLWESWQQADESITSKFEDSNGSVNLKINKLPGVVDGVTNDDIIDNIIYNDSFNDIKSEDLNNYFKNIIYNDLFNPIGDLQNEVGDVSTLSYVDRIGTYLELKDVKKMLLFGKEYNIIKDGELIKSEDQDLAIQNYKVVSDNNQDLTITNNAYDKDNTFKLSDIKIWYEKTDNKEEIHINIPKNALPVKLDKIYLNDLGDVAEYSSNTNSMDALPLRIIYSVGVKDDILDNNTIKLDNISEEYIKNNTIKEENKEYLYFYSNYYSNNNMGDAFVTFAPSSQNNFYVYQNNLIIYNDSTDGDSNGEGILSETGGKVKLSNPVKDLNDIQKDKTYYYAIYYYIPSSNGTKGKLIKYAIAAKGADFYDANNNSYLTYYNVNSRREVEEKSNNTVVATKIGKKRTINLDKLTLNKKDNITNTAPDYFGSNYGNTGENIIVSYLGNNGVIKYKTKEYLPKEPEKPEEPEILENNPQTGFMISLNILFILGIPLAIYIYSKRKRKLYKID